MSVNLSSSQNSNEIAENPNSNVDEEEMEQQQQQQDNNVRSSKSQLKPITWNDDDNDDDNKDKDRHINDAIELNDNNNNDFDDMDDPHSFKSNTTINNNYLNHQQQNHRLQNRRYRSSVTLNSRQQSFLDDEDTRFFNDRSYNNHNHQANHDSNNFESNNNEFSSYRSNYHHNNRSNQHYYGSNSNFSRMSNQENYRRNRSRSRSPPTRRFARNDRNLHNFNETKSSPLVPSRRSTTYHNNSHSNNSFNATNHSMNSNDAQKKSQYLVLDHHINPIVADAFYKLVSDATIGLVAGENEMMSFKQFIAQSDCNFDEYDAVKHYEDYKKQFKNNQLTKFYMKHKNCEWFINRYDAKKHSEIMLQRQDLRKKRLQVFFEIHQKFNMIANESVEISNQGKLNEIIELASFMIEGGSKDDFYLMNRINNNDPEQNLDDQPIMIDPDDTNSMEIINDPQNNVNESNKQHRANNLSYHNKGLFIRDFPASLHRVELEDFCSKYGPLYKRMCIQEPTSQSHYESCRVWLTFSSKLSSSDLSIESICADFNKHVFSNGKSYLALLCREVGQHRIRPFSSATLCHEIMIEDLRNVVNLVIFNDKKWGFFQKPVHDQDLLTTTFQTTNFDENPNINQLTIIESHNPLLKDISQVLVQEMPYINEMNCSEENMITKSNEHFQQNVSEKDTSAFDDVHPINDYDQSDDDVIKLDLSDKIEVLKSRLDPLLLYLRIVHSIDYYSGIECYDESLQPHVISILHTRGDSLRNRISQSTIKQFITQQQSKVKNLMRIHHQNVSDSLVKNLDFISFQDEDESVERFIRNSSQELARDKWLCLICSKKFRDFSFITKHIGNKHNSDLEQVRHDVRIFNAYLKDSQRPHESLTGLGRFDEMRSSNINNSNSNTNNNNNDKQIDNLNAKTNILKQEQDSARLYNTTLAKLSSQPVLMATLINQIVLGESSMTMKNAQQIFSNSSTFNETRPIIPYTDVDNL